jgi:hypothetical protein
MLRSAFVCRLATLHAKSHHTLKPIRHYTTASSTLVRRVFKDLGLKDENPGVYNGRWGGSGELVESINPATGEVLGRVVMVSRLHMR